MVASTNISVFITGCSSEIGRALVEAIALRGRSVVTTARNPNSILDPKSSIVRTILLDVTDGKSTTECLSVCGDIDILVNNAGKLVTGPLVELSVNEPESQFATNFFVFKGNN